MRGFIEIVVFTSIALSAHVAIFVDAAPGGVQSSGAGGETLVSLAGATAQTMQMVDEWERPPDASITTPNAVPAPEIPDMQSPQMPVLEQSAAPRILPPETVKPPTPDTDRVSIDTQSAPPPPTLAPATSERPQKRPDQVQPVSNAVTDQPARAEQRAAGSGGGSQAGQSGTSTTSTISASRRAELQAIWGAKIRSRIERRKRFPSGGRGSGQVVVLLTVSRTGQLLNYGVGRSSGSAAFDESALEAVARSGSFEAAPSELTANSYQFSLPISFSR